MSRFHGIWTLSLICILPLDSRADEPAEGPGAIFDKLDADDDGVLSPDEISEKQEQSFQRLLRIGDHDSDGRLTRSEYLAATSERDANKAPAAPDQRDRRPEAPERPGLDASRLFEFADRNGDGKLTIDELPENIVARFRPIFDSLGKTELSREDLQRFQERRSRAARPDGDVDRAGMLRRLDRNNDGKVSADEIPEEARPRLEPLLERFGEGGIDLARLEQSTDRGTSPPRSEEAGRRPGSGDMPPRPPFGREGGPVPLAIMRVVDADRDGKVTKAEFQALVERFDELDRNSDGTLEALELAGPPFDRGDRPFASRRPEGAPGARTPRSPEQRDGGGFFQRMDQNGDGAISKEEAPDMVQRRFDQLDSNRDGKLNQDELRGMLDRSRQRDPARRPE